MLIIRDAGRKETDRLLADMEQRIAKEYKQAADEAAVKLNNYMQKFKVRDAKKRMELQKGEITQKEYNEWRTGQIMAGRRWRDMTENLAKDYHNANLIAKNIVNGYMPEVYALNFNYGTYEAEHGLKVDTAFTLYDRNTVEYILRENPDLLPPISESLSKSIAEGKDIRWNKQQINSVMLQSILQGESIPKIAQRLADTVGEKNYNSAVRNARTMTTRAENYGRLDSYKRAEKMGIKMKKQWVATLDHVTRDSHVDVDGEVVDVDATFSNGLDCPGGMGPPEEVYNCFVGEVEAATDSDIIRSYKHEYEGELYSIKTAGGVNFTCTPNHPILTPKGWVAARLLNKGDDLLITFLGEKGVSGSDPDINHVFARFDTIHKFANKLGGKRTCTLGMDFHGDISTSEVEIITLKRFLGNNRNIIQTEKQGKRVFVLPDSLFMSKCAFIKHFGTVCASAFCFVRGLCQTLPFFGRSVGHSCEHGFGTVTDMNPVLPKYAIDNLPTETMIRGNLLRGLSTDVFVDKVVDVDVSFSNCHVYNLQTENGYYFVKSSIPKSGAINNGICAIAKNCRCTMIAQLKGFETDASDLSLRPTEALGDMSYGEWKDYHRSRMDEDELTARNARRAEIRERGVTADKSTLEGTKLKDRADKKGVEWVKPEKNVQNLTENDIISKIAGYDGTGGSCQSLAYTYAANELGYDVKDMRGGTSQELIASFETAIEVTKFDNVVGYVAKERTSYTASAVVEKKMEEGKKYILSCGEHSAVVRKNSNVASGIEYLELQDGQWRNSTNGWHELTGDEKHDRFRYKDVNKFGTKDRTAVLVDMDSLQNSSQFLSMMGYINNPA